MVFSFATIVAVLQTLCQYGGFLAHEKKPVDSKSYKFIDLYQETSGVLNLVHLRKTWGTLKRDFGHFGFIDFIQNLLYNPGVMDDRTIRSIFEREPTQEIAPGQEPSEVDLSPEDAERIKSARDLLTTLVKTFKAYRLYLSNNDLLLRFQAELAQKFQDFFGKFSDLELRIRQSTITLMGQPIYRSQEQTDNLAQQLYRDGFRRITFHEGLPPAELTGFLEILKKTADRSAEHDSDAVTLFWEKDFKFVTYHAVEEMLPEGVDINEADAMADAHIEKIATLNYYTDETLSLSSEPDLGVAEAEKRQDIYDNIAPSEETIMKSQLVQSFLALESTEIIKIQQQIRNEKTEDLLLDMADVILEVIYIEHTFEDFQLLVEALEQILFMYYSFLDLERATEILKKLHHLADGYRQTSSKAAAYVDEVIERSGSEDRLQQLFTALAQGQVFSISTLGTFLVHLGASAIPAICRSLNETTSQDLRKNLCDVLVLLGKKHFNALLEHLDDKTEKGIRNKIYILTRINDDRAVPFFRKLIQHPSSAIRQLIITSLSRFYNPLTRDLLLQSLRDADITVRLNVLRVLAQTQDQKALDFILPIVSEPSFHEKDLQEKKFFFSTLASLGGNELVDSFGNILHRKNLKDLSKDDEVRICAAEALGQIGSDEALVHLNAGLKLKRKAIVQSCGEQIELIGQRREG